MRVGLAALCAFTAVACATPGVLSRARGSTESESRDTAIRAVKRAGLLGSGALLLCVELRSFRRRQVHVEIPLQSIGTPRARTGFEFGREKGFDGPSPDDPGSLRYVFFQDDFDDGCPEKSKPVPVYASEGAKDPNAPGVYTTRTKSGLGLRYVSQKPLWSSLRALEIAPVLEAEELEVEVPGKPVWYLALPFALVLDAVFTLFTFGLLF